MRCGENKTTTAHPHTNPILIGNSPRQPIQHRFTPLRQLVHPHLIQDLDKGVLLLSKDVREGDGIVDDSIPGMSFEAEGNFRVAGGYRWKLKVVTAVYHRCVCLHYS